MFEEQMASNLIVPVECKSADEDECYRKRSKEHMDEFAKNANTEISIDSKQLGVFFKKCIDSYHHAEIDLYEVEKDAKTDT